MEPLTYSRMSGCLLKEIEVLDHPSTSRNVSEPPSRAAMLDPSKNPTVQFGGMNSTMVDTSNHQEVRKDPDTVRHNRESNVPRTAVAAKIEGIRNQKETKKEQRNELCVVPLPFHLKNAFEGGLRRGKKMMKQMRGRHILLWLILLLFSLCPKSASSQVSSLISDCRVASMSIRVD